MTDKRRIGIVGYGHLGCFLTEKILASEYLELAFVWNRSAKPLRDSKLDGELILENLDDFADRKADLIVEVAHPIISKTHGARFLRHADYMIGSPTALADEDVESNLRAAAKTYGLYVPSGAFWGAQDIAKMADRGTLKGLKVSMTKHPSCFRVHADLQKKISDTERVVLYEGPVRSLCPLAPNNVNTMAAAAIAAHSLGFDGVQAALIADPANERNIRDFLPLRKFIGLVDRDRRFRVTDYHVVEVDVLGPGEAGCEFHVHTCRCNPASVGAVTGTATYNSFFSSVLGASGFGPGVHMC